MMPAPRHPRPTAELHRVGGVDRAARHLPNSAISDLRFRQLLSPQDWDALPVSVKARFGHTAAQIIYEGKTCYTRMNRAGWALAHMLRIIGAPLPLSQHAAPRPARVTVDETPSGHRWTRDYEDGRGRVQRIVSEKRFAGRSGLEEMITPWLGMTLKVKIGDCPEDGLYFCGTGFNLLVHGRRIPLPRWLCPGQLEVRHIPLTPHRFAFTLTITHPWLGPLIEQCGEFVDPAQGPQP